MRRNLSNQEGMFLKCNITMDKVLITGGTGSIGRALASIFTTSQVTIFSRNEKDQVEMKQDTPQYKYVIGDVRDESEVLKACHGKEYVFHLAALKHVNICEEQPYEAVRTNVIGTMNIVTACQQYGCQMINMSSDKAISPVNVYGRTKALAEAMVREAGFTNIRSGNVLWSSGSVLPIWKKQLHEENVIRLTSREMTRFFIHPLELVKFILSHKDDQGTFTAPMKSFRLIDIAEEFIHRFGDNNSTILFTEPRSGERMHEFRDENTSSEKDICADINYIFQ
jgi:UDP-N-acetylglucosamine 4,6-dehydratase/5-epimerase